MRIQDLKEKEGIHCKTEEEANRICKLMHEAGLSWCDGESYLENNNWHVFKDRTCYDPQKGKCCLIDYSKDYKIYDSTQFKNNEMKKIKAKDAQRIIDISCSTWKETLAKKWGIEIVQNKDIEIPENDYKEMRKACTDSQNKLFDEIFGKDELEFKVGDWVYVGGNGWNDTDNKYFKTTSSKGDVFQISGFKNQSSGDYRVAISEDGRCVYIENYNNCFRLATPEEIDKAQQYPDGTPCLVRDSINFDWKIRYADGKGKFYRRSRKSGMVVDYKYHQKLDINNLPINE